MNTWGKGRAAGRVGSDFLLAIAGQRFAESGRVQKKVTRGQLCDDDDDDDDDDGDDDDDDKWLSCWHNRRLLFVAYRLIFGNIENIIPEYTIV